MDPHYIIDPENNRIEFSDNRFYACGDGKYVPSSTTLLEAYPKGAAYYEWLKRVGQDADELRDDAGRRGSVVHNLTEQLDRGQEVIGAVVGEGPLYRMSEWAMLERYVEFRKRFSPVIEEIELRLVSESLGYAGTLDRIMVIDGRRYIVDIKTSNALYDHYWLQIASYWNLWQSIKKVDADIAATTKLAVLWLNAKTRGDGRGDAIQGAGWQLVEAPDDHETLLDLFEGTAALWHRVNKNWKPRNLSYSLKHQLKPQTNPIENGQPVH